MNVPSEESCFNVNFGAGVGRFKIGTHINDVLEVFSNEYPRINLEIFFSKDEGGDNVSLPSPARGGDGDIRVGVPQWGICLRFQPLSQRLYLIDIHNFNVSITFNINGYVIRGQEQPTTFNQLQKAIGPTFPGKFVDNDGHYLLCFAGVGLLFAVPPRFQSLYTDGTVLPIVLPDKSSAALERVYVHGREFDMEQPEQYPDVLATSARLFLQEQQPHQQSQNQTAWPLGSHFRLRGRNGSVAGGEEGGSEEGVGSGEESCLALGMSPQDVVSTLGAPDFASLSPQHAEPFIHKYEYRALGIELYFSKNTHVVFRIVAHTNPPQHQDFGRFRRCAFVMTPLTSTGTDSNSDSISAMTPWSQAQVLLSQWFPTCSGGSSGGAAAAIKPVPAGCPFAPSRLHAFPSLGVMFEVAGGGGAVSSVTLLDPLLVES